MYENKDEYQLEKMDRATLINFLKVKECEQKEKSHQIKNLKISRNIRRILVCCWVFNSVNFAYRTIDRKSQLESIALLVSVLNLFFNSQLCKKSNKEIRNENEKFLKIGEQIDTCKKLIKRFDCNN